MAIGDVRAVTRGDCTDLHYVDTGMYGTAEYGAVYLLSDERPALVETGIGTNHDLVLEALETVGIAREDLAVIAVSHVHLDHAGGAGVLAEACPNAEVYVHELGLPHLADPSRLVAGTKAAVGDQWAFYTEPKPVPEDRLTALSEGDTIDLGTHELRVHEAPGHAPHQVVFEDPANDAIFTADAAGIWVPSVEVLKETSPPPQFDLERCLEDVAALRALERSTLLYTHFGPRETGEALAAYETVLTDWVEAVTAKREELGDDVAVVEHFASETEMADVWGERKATAETAMNVRGVCAYLDRLE
ncbi:MBL fold metallo-hydrolase [Natronobiforma cellulositropha]|uniref:MBL fold metallo-hydrolase n=1 Tax=Natronobiforma cellulositropha TaxID=1679076 RepID=UPI0021D59AA7|nr:MBL fold metallo-hydrolase [Natronobiforma cellulositropha]